MTLPISPSTLPDGRVRAAYSQTLSASGGIGDRTWTLIDGALPEGLSFDSTITTASIDGTPLESGTFDLTVGVETAAFHSLYIPNTSASVSYGDLAFFHNAPDLTWSGWFKRTSLASDHGWIWQKHAGLQACWAFLVTGAGLTIYIATNPTTFASWTISNASAGITAGNWFHLGVVFNGALTGNSNRLNVYVNGVHKTASGTFSGTIPATLQPTTASVKVGGTGFNGNALETTYADELALWDSALNSTQIGALYTAGQFAAVAPTPTDWRRWENDYADSMGGTAGTPSGSPSFNVEQAGDSGEIEYELFIEPQVATIFPSSDVISGGREIIIYGDVPIFDEDEDSSFSAQSLPSGWTEDVDGSGRVSPSFDGTALSTGTESASFASVVSDYVYESFDASLSFDVLGPNSVSSAVSLLGFTFSLEDDSGSIVVQLRKTPNLGLIVDSQVTIGGTTSFGGARILDAPPDILRIVRNGRFVWIFADDAQLTVCSWFSTSRLGRFVISADNEASTHAVKTKIYALEIRSNAAINERLLLDRTDVSTHRITGGVPAATLSEGGPASTMVFGPWGSVSSSTAFAYVLPPAKSTGRGLSNCSDISVRD